MKMLYAIIMMLLSFNSFANSDCNIRSTVRMVNWYLDVPSDVLAELEVDEEKYNKLVISVKIEVYRQIVAKAKSIPGIENLATYEFMQDPDRHEWNLKMAERAHRESIECFKREMGLRRGEVE